MKIYITADFSEEGIQRLKAAGHEVRTGGYGFEKGLIRKENELINAIGDAEVLIVGYEPITKDVLEKTGLKIICSIRGGPEANIDIDVATERGIPVIYTKGREAIPVADFTMGQILALVRHIVKTDRELRTGKFTRNEGALNTGRDVTWDMSATSPWESRKGIELSGKIHGLIGFGTIGQEVCKRSLAFGTRVFAYDPFTKDKVFIRTGALKVDLDELLKKSDIISIHARVTKDNCGMLGEREFGLMKDGVYFINNARAAITDETAQRNALRSGKLGGLALDVYHQEPIRKDDEYFKYDNVILTPHIAGAGKEVIFRHSRMVIDDLLALLSGAMPISLFNPESLKKARLS